MPVQPVTSQVGPVTSWDQRKPASNPWFEDKARYIYVLQPTDIGEAKMPAYDCNTKVVVVARDSKVARQLANGLSGDEKRVVDERFWLNTVYTSCHKLGLARKPNGQSPAREKVVCAEGTFQ